MEVNAIRRSLAVLLFAGYYWSGHIEEDKDGWDCRTQEK
jgi:hypothetical protein